MALLDDKGLKYFVGKLKGMFAPKNHTHDDRYYTESEIDGKLSGKANSSHTHTKAQVGLGNVDNTADSAKSVKAATKLQTYKQGSTTETYGDSYPLYAQWSGNNVVMKCDNYTVWTDRASVSNSANAVAWENVSGKPSTYTPSSHTHSYAGAASSGGSATSAVKLDTSTAGSATQPVYFTGGKPAACTYTLGKSVPSNAVFTDTTYSDATTSAHGLMTASDKTKLNGIATGANKTVVDNALSQGSANPVANSAITKRLQYLYSFKISRDKWNESSDKSNWNVIVPWSDSSGTALTGSTTGTPNLTTNMSLGPAMMERTSSLSDNIILSGELSMINQGQIYVCDTNKLSFTVKRRPVCDLMLYFYARQWTT